MTDTTITATTTPAATLVNRKSAIKEIAVFLGTTAALLAASTTVALGQDVDVRHIDDATALGQAAMYGQAAFPLIGALVARLATHGTLRRPGFGFRRTSWRSIGIAWLYALAATLAGGVLVWVTGAAGFDSGGLSPSVLLGLTVLTLPYIPLAIGEDIGWRGVLVNRLAEISGPRTVVLVGGLAWSAFHWPLILLLGGTPQGVPPIMGVVLFTVFNTALGAVLANMQLRWGIWPGVIAHAVGNAVMYHVLTPLTVENAHSGWFATETGLMSVITGIAGALLWWRFAPLVRTPDGGTAPGTRR
ncbi:CPBP family intramembrane glutamic endopeptidase [Actinoplanes sp. CA-030573]|uniref:CPBP family intramembrane glutamic endopeptidase n=1 Tax=Actinoplanes sp. CA-030573 TaxID=3239898 RepID=UPI003D938B7D